MLDFVEYIPTPQKRTPPEDLKLFESPISLSPAWSQPRSFEQWRLRDLREERHAFGDGKAGLEAEAEGHEPGEGLRTMDGKEPKDEADKEATMASSITEPESRNVTEWLLEVHKELEIGGKGPHSSLAESGPQSGGSEIAYDRGESQGGGPSESPSTFSPPDLDPLAAFLDMFEGGSSTPQDS